MSDLVPTTGTALALSSAQSIADFTEAWLANRRLSDHTRAAYRRDVALWVAWCAERDLNPLQARFLDVNAWGRDLEQPDPRTGRTPAVSTVARRMSAVSSWYDYLVRLGAIPVNPAAGADRPRVDRDHSPTIGMSATDATALLAAATADDRWLGPAAPAVAAVLVDLGVRVSEVCAVDIADLGHDSGHRTLSLRMKGGKRRRRSLPPATAVAIDRYLTARAAREGLTVAELDGPLFVDRHGVRVGRHMVARLVRRLASAANVADAGRITPHSLRHAWNAIARERGATLEDRQHAMGHADPRTTQRYDQQRGSLDRDPAWLVASALPRTTDG